MNLLKFTYTNWRGERSERHVIPNRIYYGVTEYHREPQWMMEAYDVEKNVMRTFAMKSIQGFDE